MATRSTIALEAANGTVTQIYCHWDGYLDYNGKILFEHYQDPAKVQQLMELGDISVLKESVDCPEGHSFDTPAKGCTIAYGRDRGETETEAVTYENFDRYRLVAQFEDYNYILRADGKWYLISDCVTPLESLVE